MERELPPPRARTSAETLTEALRLLAEHRPQEAIPLVRGVLDRDPENPMLWAALGMALSQGGDAEAGVTALERAHFLQPASASILHNYGLALEAAGRHADALLRFHAARQVDPLYQPPAEPAPAPAPPPPRAAPPPTALEPLPPPRERPRPPPPAPRREEPYEERAPGFGGLTRGVMELWVGRPLVWLVVQAPALALGAAPSEPLGWVGVLVWIAAAGLAAGPLLVLMTNTWLGGRPLAGPEPQRRVGVTTACTLVYLLVTLAVPCLLMALRARFPAYALVLASLLMTLPFHALAAPMLALAAAEGSLRGGRLALRRAGGRTWMHLGVMAAVSLTAGGLLAAVAWAFAVSLRPGGDVVPRVLAAGAVALGLSLWCALMTVCGLDAVDSAERS